MKILFTFISLTFLISSAHACVDVRAADFAPCAQGQERVFVQGPCAKTYEAESTYCSNTATAPKCRDARATLFLLCQNGETRIYVQGKCLRRVLFEHSYCAQR